MPVSTPCPANATVVTSRLVAGTSEGIEWVLLVYRVPREPSTPRIAIWRRLKRLGVGQLGDGLVALPADARTQEQLEWVAEQVEQSGGQAGVWRARATSREQERRVVVDMAAARAAEYRLLQDKVDALTAADDAATIRSALVRLRAELRRIERRDHFPPPERAQVRSALREIATTVNAEDRERT